MPIRPVVEDVAEEVGVGPDNGLWLEEIVRHELDPAGHVSGHGVEGPSDHVGKVLHNEVEVAVRLREGDADVAARAAHVNNKAGVFTAVAIELVAVALGTVMLVTVTFMSLSVITFFAVPVYVADIANDRRPVIAFAQELG